MRGTFVVCTMALCFVFLCSGSPMFTSKKPRWSTTSSTEVPVTNQLSVSLLEIFKNNNNSIPKEAAASNCSSENLFVMLKNRIYSYRDLKKAYDINHPAGNPLLKLKDKIHRYVVVTKKTPDTNVSQSESQSNQSSESSIVTHKNQSENTLTAPDENEFSGSPFVTLKYEDYHARLKEEIKNGVNIQRRPTSALMKKLQFYMKQFQELDFENVIKDYVANHLDF